MPLPIDNMTCAEFPPPKEAFDEMLRRIKKLADTPFKPQLQPTVVPPEICISGIKYRFINRLRLNGYLRNKWLKTDNPRYLHIGNAVTYIRFSDLFKEEVS